MFTYAGCRKFSHSSVNLSIAAHTMGQAFAGIITRLMLRPTHGHTTPLCLMYLTDLVFSLEHLLKKYKGVGYKRLKAHKIR